jgi:hypothetical protein
MGQLEAPDFPRDGPRICAFLVPKQFAFEQSRGIEAQENAPKRDETSLIVELSLSDAFSIAELSGYCRNADVASAPPPSLWPLGNLHGPR